MADTTYLQKRGDCRYIRVPKPPGLWGITGPAGTRFTVAAARQSG